MDRVRIQVDQIQPTNAELMRLIIQQSNAMEQLKNNVDELKAMVKGLQQTTVSQRNRNESLNIDANEQSRNRRTSGRTPTREISLEQQGFRNQTFLLRNVLFSELEEACNGWCEILGAGGFGEVYKGLWNGQNIAVKRLRNDKKPGDVQVAFKGDDAYQKYIQQTFTELQMLHCYPAENILPLLAFSFDEFLRTDPCLIYLHMVNGSVLDRLRQKNGTPPLSWDTRANIALGTARGLTHLHAHGIKHGDIKSGNVLLDKHFEAKIGDFGLARGGPDEEANTHITVSMVVGTKHYLPEDFMRNGKLGPEVDTFSYGIFLFELVSGKGPSVKVGNSTVREIMLDPNNDDPTGMVDRNYGEMAILQDPMQSKWPVCLYRLGKDCTKTNRKDRPAMSKVFSALDFLHKHPSLQEKATSERREEFMQVQFPGPIPTILDDETDTSVGIMFNAKTGPSNTDISTNIEMSDDRSISPLLHTPVNRNPLLHKNFHLYDEALPSMSGHIRNIYALT